MAISRDMNEIEAKVLNAIRNCASFDLPTDYWSETEKA